MGNLIRDAQLTLKMSYFFDLEIESKQRLATTIQ